MNVCQMGNGYIATRVTNEFKMRVGDFFCVQAYRVEDIIINSSCTEKIKYYLVREDRRRDGF